MPSRTLRYSGSERPACRMNHTGVSVDRLLARSPHEVAVVEDVGERSPGESFTHRSGGDDGDPHQG